MFPHDVPELLGSSELPAGSTRTGQEQILRSTGELAVRSQPTNDETTRLGYFSLPPELRNRIMRLAFVPGEICPPGPPVADMYRFKNCRPEPCRSGLGVQLLAANRQAYNEGRTLYYPLNTFEIPSPPLSACEELLSRYQAENLALVRHVKLTCKSTLVVYLGLLNYAEKEALQAAGKSDIKDILMNNVSGQKAFGRGIGWPLYEHWKKSLCLIQRVFPYLESLTIQRPPSSSRESPDLFVIKGQDLKSQFESLRQVEYTENEEELDIQILWVVHTSARICRCIMVEWVLRVGWEKAKKRCERLVDLEHSRALKEKNETIDCSGYISEDSDSKWVQLRYGIPYEKDHNGYYDSVPVKCGIAGKVE